MKTPSKFLLLLEGVRSLFEYAQSIVLTLPLQYIAPKGDGHPVIIFPGLGTADSSTQFMRTYLTSLGYNVYPWGLGRNLGPRDGLLRLTHDIETSVRSISEQNGNSKVTLIGWSLGGIYARELAKTNPELVRQVITLGTPFKNAPSSTNATKLYELLSKDKSHLDDDMIRALAVKPIVPFTSIYSKTDGVVHWEACIEDDTEFSENIEIPSASHLGLGHNPIVMHIIATRLCQPENAWARYN